MSGATVIVGAGMAGLACARHLSDAGLAVCVLDKGRGPGGRMATRRVEARGKTLRFDHGAQYFTARDPRFGAFLERFSGAVAVWADGADERHLVGVPGMSGLPRAMSAGLDLRQGVTVTSVRPAGDGWEVVAGDRVLTAERVVLALPAPQAAALLGDHAPVALAKVRLAPCLTLMAALAPGAGTGVPWQRMGPEAALPWIARDSSKPGREDSAATCWVAQAGPAFSARHLDDDLDRVAARMLPLLCQAIGADPAAVLHASAHRWRYARVEAALGMPFLHGGAAAEGLYLGGDWCLGPRVEAAWQSGTAIAADIAARGGTA